MASLEPAALLNGSVHINTLAFEAPDIRVARPTPDGAFNFQFILDNIRKDSTGKETGLRINQLLIYDGSLRYDVHSQEPAAGRLDPFHIAVSNFSCNVSLKNFNKENLNLYVRSIKGIEKSGIELRKAKARIFTQENGLRLTGLLVELPGTSIESGSIQIDSLYGGLQQMRIGGSIHSSRFSFEDIRPILPKDIPALPDITFSISAAVCDSIAQGTASITAQAGTFSFEGNARIAAPYSERRIITAHAERLHTTEEGMLSLAALFPSIPSGLAHKLGDTSISGEITCSRDTLGCNLSAACSSGAAIASVSIDSIGNYRLNAKGKRIDLGRLLGNNDIKRCDIKAVSRGSIHDKARLAAFEAEIASLEFKGYTYSPFTIKGNAGSNGASATLIARDPGIEGSAAFSLAKGRRGDRYTLALDIDTFMPHRLNLSKEYKDNGFAFRMEGEHTILGRRKSMTSVKVRDFVHDEGNRKSQLKNIYIYDDNTGKERSITVNSDILTADIIGQFTLSSIYSSLMGIPRQHLPSLNVQQKGNEHSNFFYRVDIKESSMLTRLLRLPATINERALISGSCNDSSSSFGMNADISDISIGSARLRSMSLKGTSSASGLDIDASIIMPSAKDAEDGMIINLSSSIAQDSINSIADWASLSSEGNNGTLGLGVSLQRDAKENICFDAKVVPSSITLNGQEWSIAPGSIAGNSKKFTVENLRLSNESQSIDIYGTAGKLIDDSLNVILNDIDVSTIMGLTNFRVLSFGGKATGKAHLTSLLHSLDVNGRFSVDSLLIDGAHMGDGDIGIGWMNYNKTLSLDCDIIGKSATSRVTGYLSQPRDTIILKIEANDLNVGFLEEKIDAFVSDVQGKGNGTVYVLGRWSKVDLAGAAALDCSLKVNANNTTYYISGDTVRLSPGIILFDDIAVKDRNGNNGTLSGLITHKNFSRWTCNLDVAARNMLVYDTPDFGNLPFYGTVYATGTANINSPGSGLLLKANLRSEPNSFFIYNSSTASGAGDNSFVTFTDSRKESKQKRSTLSSTPGNTYDFVTSKLNLEFMLDVTESLHVKVYTNLKTDDYIDFYGKGTINALYDEKDGFSMKGGLELDRGTYKFTIQDIFPKEFKIDKGSTLTFDGDPFRAGLGLKTRYLVASASLGDLSTEVSRNKTVKVNCVMDIGGTLESPDLSFDLELPEGSEEEKELLASIANTKEQKTMQFIYLLGVGKFYTFDYNSTGEEIQSSTAVESLISNTLSGQLNNMLGHIIDNDNWDISGNFSTSERGWNRMEVEGMLRGRLLNNRLLINGNFGYRENPIANSNFIGDFELQYLLNKKGTVNLKAYSKTNDRYFSNTNLTTQGAGLLFKFDFNRWRWWKKDEDNE